ncbi:MAG: 4Fe-4S dicluster domain-containing protein, partial [Thermodesulfobacteriota bacterium]|nr:4Fe-4S dicluster domain-containing protein [Thermodesulfobacteriota bacterium]
MELDFGVMKDLSLLDQEKRDLKISSMLRGAFYCQQCRSCVTSCPKSVEIPALMRAYMYAEGYGNLIQAQLTVHELPAEYGLNVCRECATCSAICPHGIEIQYRLASLMTMIPGEYGAA